MKTLTALVLTSILSGCALVSEHPGVVAGIAAAVTVLVASDTGEIYSDGRKAIPGEPCKTAASCY